MKKKQWRQFSVMFFILFMSLTMFNISVWATETGYLELEDDETGLVKEKVFIKDCTITLSMGTYTYDGIAKQPTVTLKYGENTLSKGKDYTVVYSNNMNAGTAKVVITGTGNYTGEVTKTFTINKAANVITAKNFTKNASTKAQVFSLGAKATSGTVTYSSNNSSVTVSSAGKVAIKANYAGTAKITLKVAESANYKAVTKTVVIKVNPTKTTLSSVTNVSGKKMKVIWKKNTIGSGYQLQYSTNSKFTSGNKAVLASSNKTLTKTITGLTKGKTYYVRIRTYKTVSGTKLYSAWSAAKKVKITK